MHASGAVLGTPRPAKGHRRSEDSCTGILRERRSEHLDTVVPAHASVHAIAAPVLGRSGCRIPSARCVERMLVASMDDSQRDVRRGRQVGDLAELHAGFHGPRRDALDVSVRIRDAARAKRAAVAARRAAAAADTSLGLHMGAGGAYVPRVTLLLAGAEAPRRSRVRTAAAAAAANSGPISTIGLL